MSQFDVLLICPLLFSLFISLYCYYLYSINILIPYYIETKKFRIKKIKNLNNLISKINCLNLFYITDFNKQIII
jgi:hypothetical protein